MIITSQHYLDDTIVDAKISANNFEVFVSPMFEIDGDEYQVIIDGHHSFAAAMKCGVTPIITTMTVKDHDAIEFIKNGDVTGFLDVMHMGEGEYIDAITRKYVWY